MPVINTIELEGVSATSWGDAAREALREAAKTIRGINRLEVVSTATTGFTYAYVETSDVRACPRSHEYDANPTHDPMTIR